MFEPSRYASTPVRTVAVAARLEEPGRFRLVEVPKRDPAPNEVLVRLEGCGVCASNLPPFQGREWFRYPMEPGALGHEGWGHVEAVGREVIGLAEGDRVAMLSGNAYASHDVAPASHVVRLPAEIEGLPFPGEPLGCAVNIFKRSGIRPGDTVVIVGIGFLGALLTQIAVGRGARVLAVSRRPTSREFALRFGAEAALEMGERWQVRDHIAELTQGVMADVVVEAVGNQAALDLASDLARERGRLVIAGYHQDGLRQVNLQQWNWLGLDVINAHERDPAVYIDGIRTAADLVAEGFLDPTPLYTHRYSLSELGEALRATDERPAGFMKAIVTTEVGP